MNTNNGTSKLLDNPILSQPKRYRLLATILALVSAGSVAISAAYAQEPPSASVPPETCSCGCPYCCLEADVPTYGVGRTEKESEKAIGKDVLDYTNGVCWAWDGSYSELWEMELFYRIAYLEFWGTSEECVKAGIDSILQLWKSGYYGDSLGRLLSATCETGAYVYSPYAYVWNWNYDQKGLEEIKALCLERFSNGPEYCAPFFQLWYYPAWATPCYEIDGVYFSTFKR